MKPATALFASVLALCGTVAGRSAEADVVIPYNEYSDSPTIGRGAGSSTDPRSPGYGGMRIFIEKVKDYTDDKGPSALPAGQKVIFVRDQGTGREVNALRAGIQFANRVAMPKALVSEPSWGFVYNSVPFGMRLEQMLEFLYDAKIDGFAGSGLELAQSLLDSRGGSQIVLPVVGSTMQGSGYFPKPIGKADCIAEDSECASHGGGIGLAGLCASPWRIRYLAPAQNILDGACDLLVKRGLLAAKTLAFYPAVGGQSVLLPMQRGAIQGFEYVNPYDDLVEFFPIKGATATAPLGRPDAGQLNCAPALGFPIAPGTPSNCSQNIGQIGARYAHHPSWHQPFLISWIHVDKAIWNGLTAGQRAAISRAAKESVRESYDAAESMSCVALKAILDFNAGVQQRAIDGSLRVIDGKPVSAAMTMARWPDDALKVLLESTNDYMASLAGPQGATASTEAQRDFGVVWKAVRQHGAKIGAGTFDPGRFPGKPGLVAGEDCRLVN